jgi:ABC-type glycerol-3-phosphate transport system substrate-binding protein
VVHGIDRPNLFLDVLRVESETDDRRVLRKLFQENGHDESDTIGRQLADDRREVLAAVEAPVQALELGGQAVEAFEHYLRLLQYMPPAYKTGQMDIFQIQELFMQGKVAAIIDWVGLGEPVLDAPKRFRTSMRIS